MRWRRAGHGVHAIALSLAPDLTPSCRRAILRCVVPPSSHRLCGRRNNSGHGLPFPFATRAGRLAGDVARCRHASPHADPWFFIRLCPAQRQAVPSQLNRDDAHVPDPFRLVRWSRKRPSNPYNEEFDPGSGRTLAACLMHASRTRRLRAVSGARLRITWEHASLWGTTARKRC